MKQAINFAACVLAAFAITGCSGEQTETPAGGFTPEENPVAGLTWSYPASWSRQHDQPMRVATYVIPSSEEGMEAGECGVFYFGPQQGGDVDANIQRWGAQFEGAKQAKKTSMEIEGMQVTVVRIEGTFLAPGGPMMQSQGTMEGYKLLGAIVEGPEGMVFFKCTGPQQTIESAEAAFLSMIRSIRKNG